MIVIMKKVVVAIFGFLPFLLSAEEFAKGVVFEDLNGNEVRDSGEKGISGVGVSDGSNIVETDAEGHWRLPIAEDVIYFVLKPSGWMVPLSKDMLPRFHYVHKPKGSPEGMKHAGVAPTGPLPKSIDFPLRRQEEPGKFSVIFFGDPQPRNQTEIDYIAHDVVEGIVGTKAKFGVTLGDIMFDDLSLFGSFNKTVALVGIPWYNVIGNHDLNFEADEDRFSDETFERVYGPAYYSFDFGKVHFLVLDNVEWSRRDDGRRHYVGNFGARQMAFVEQDLARVPEDRLVVLSMHIPLNITKDRQNLFRLIEDRPYTISLSGHTHWQAHHFIDKHAGWKGKEPHHHIVNVTVSGSWWRGTKDYRGIPHATMRDGAPNGHSVLTFDGHNATFDFQAAGKPADYQLRVHAPEEVAQAELANTYVYVNVFAGSIKSKVRMRVGPKSKWIELRKTPEKDPWYVAMQQLESRNKQVQAVNGATVSQHLWKGKLPAKLSSGQHLIEVVTTDMYGREFKGTRIIRVK
jgi:hypothetical protein